jgi:hypothetical protein
MNLQGKAILARNSDIIFANKADARRHGSLCTGRYSRGKQAGLLCLKVSKFLVRGEGRCGRHTHPKMRTPGRAL